MGVIFFFFVRARVCVCARKRVFDGIHYTTWHCVGSAHYENQQSIRSRRDVLARGKPGRPAGDVQVAISPRAHAASPGALLGRRGDANTRLVIIVLK